VISAVKLAEDQPHTGQTVIIRIYEAHGRTARGTLQVKWPISRVEEVDLNEHVIGELKMTGDGFGVKLNPHEIKTFKLYANQVTTM
jgi:alpha-mannosidase